jgi:hypothetical protein
MLGMKTYPREYIDACRKRVKADLRAWREPERSSAGTEFVCRFFNGQVLLLDYMFVHRLSGIEGKDGNPLNEVRVLCNSLLLHGGVLQVERLPGWPASAVAGLKLPADKSVLKLAPGAQVRLREADFVKLSEAFFSELERRYAE